MTIYESHDCPFVITRQFEIVWFIFNNTLTSFELFKTEISLIS